MSREHNIKTILKEEDKYIKPVYDRLKIPLIGFFGGSPSPEVAKMSSITLIDYLPYEYRTNLKLYRR